MASDWTSVKDAYPAKGQRVLVWFGDEPEPYMDVWKYDGENQYFRPGPRKKGHENALPHQCVTHWELLPPPPVQP